MSSDTIVNGDSIQRAVIGSSEIKNPDYLSVLSIPNAWTKEKTISWAFGIGLTNSFFIFQGSEVPLLIGYGNCGLASQPYIFAKISAESNMNILFCATTYRILS